MDHTIVGIEFSLFPKLIVVEKVPAPSFRHISFSWAVYAPILIVVLGF